MKRSLRICAVITAACLSLSTAYSTQCLDNNNDPYTNNHEYKYDIMTQANCTLKSYISLVNNTKIFVDQKYGICFNDKSIAAKTISSINLLTHYITEPGIQVYGVPTKETNDWYLKFARYKGHNFAARLNTNTSCELNDVFGILKVEFGLNNVKDESYFKKDPSAKLRFQLMVLTSYSALESIGGTFAFARLSTYDRFAGFQQTLDDLEGLLKELEYIKIPIEFRVIVQQIYVNAPINSYVGKQEQADVIYFKGYKIIKSSEPEYVNMRPDKITLAPTRGVPALAPLGYVENIPYSKDMRDPIGSKSKHWTQK